MGCNPPYNCGNAPGTSGSWCGCSCSDNCFPPNPCYTGWSFIYNCGDCAAPPAMRVADTEKQAGYIATDSSCVYTPDAPLGSKIYESYDECMCSAHKDIKSCENLKKSSITEIEEVQDPELLSLTQLDVDFPKFNYNPEEDFTLHEEDEEYTDDDGNIVYILSSPCSIPACEEKTVSVSFGGCCMVVGTEGHAAGYLKFIAIGDGTVTVDTPSTSCGQFNVTINGTNTKSKQVSNCDVVEIFFGLTPISGACPCACNFISDSGTLLPPPCAPAFKVIKRRNLKTGKSKTYVNKKELIKRVTKKKNSSKKKKNP